MHSVVASSHVVTLLQHSTEQHTCALYGVFVLHVTTLFGLCGVVRLRADLVLLVLPKLAAGALGSVDSMADPILHYR